MLLGGGLCALLSFACSAVSCLHSVSGCVKGHGTSIQYAWLCGSRVLFDGHPLSKRLRIRSVCAATGPILLIYEMKS